MSAPHVAAISAVTAANPAEAPLPAAPQTATAAPATSFYKMISTGIDKANQRAAEADAQVKAFILDDSVPPHRVIYALEKAQMSLQLMLQVRNRVVEGYQEIMRMQL